MDTIYVNGVNAVKCGDTKYTSGMTGARIRIVYNEDWNGFNKTVCFSNGCIQKDILSNEEVLEIPHEVLASPNRELKVGVYGVKDTVIIPTIWAKIGRVLPGTNPNGDESVDPTPPVYSQIQKQIGSLDDLNTVAKENLVSAINEVKELRPGQIGGVSETFVKEQDVITLNSAKKYTDDKVGLPEHTTMVVNLTLDFTESLTSVFTGTADHSSTEITSWVERGGNVLAVVQMPPPLSYCLSCESTAPTSSTFMCNTPDRISLVVVVGPDKKFALSQIFDTDLGIRNARVRQIAEIVDVDQDGVPIAWKPVDMPKDGGHYTPVVTQPDADHMQIDFKGSDPAMSAVQPVTVALPKGSGGSFGGPLEKLTFTGAVSEEYDGTKPVSVEIPAGGIGKGWRHKTIVVSQPVTEIIEDLEQGTHEIWVRVSTGSSQKQTLGVAMPTDTNSAYTKWATKSKEVYTGDGWISMVLHPTYKSMHAATDGKFVAFAGPAYWKKTTTVSFICTPESGQIEAGSEIELYWR